MEEDMWILGGCKIIWFSDGGYKLLALHFPHIPNNILVY